MGVGAVSGGTVHVHLLPGSRQPAETSVGLRQRQAGSSRDEVATVSDLARWFSGWIHACHSILDCRIGLCYADGGVITESDRCAVEAVRTARTIFWNKQISGRVQSYSKVVPHYYCRLFVRQQP